MNSPGNKALIYIFLPILFLSFVVLCSVPLSDSDLWWHLATGKYIVQNKALLEVDPFSYTSEPISPHRVTLLNGYWLAQVVFYLSYLVSGNYGVIALRVLILISGLFVSLLIALRFGAKLTASIILLVLASLTLTIYSPTRPQLFSFMFAPVVFYLLDRLKQKYRASEINIKSYLLLPAVMLLWANLHGGFLLGSTLIFIFTLSEAAHVLVKREAFSKQFLLFSAISIAAVACTLINPNTYKMYPMLFAFEGSTIQTMTSEYVSPFALGYNLLWWWIYLALSIVILAVSFKRCDKTHLIIVMFLGAISLSAARYIPFFVLVTLPVLAINLTRITAVSKRLYIPAVVSVLLTLFIVTTGFQRTLGLTLKQDRLLIGYPENAAAFILENSPAGNIFNHFNWGGYLIWKLYPNYKVFIDGRSLNLEVFKHYTYMLWDRNTAGKLLDYYGIKTVIMPPPPSSGKGYELVNILNEDSQWRLVFKDISALVYVRGEENERLKQIFNDNQ
jgi:hypothetical protein